MTSARRGAAAAKRQPGSEVSPLDLGPAELARIQAVLRAIECARQQEEPGGAVQAFVPPGSALRAYARTHKAPLSAAVVVGAADLTVLAAHAAGGPAAYGAVAALAAAAGGRVAWKHRPKAKRRKRARRGAAALWTASTATALAGTAAGMASGPGQLVMLGGGLAVAAPYLWHARRRPVAPTAPDELPVLTAPDPRIEAFRARFCRSGPCKNAALHSVRDIPDGFAFEVTLAEETGGTFSDVFTLIPKIAALYDVSADQVSVEYLPGRSERRAGISVLTVADAWDRDDAWDGSSTYDPASGTFRLGRFADNEDMHWLLHRPGSGAAGGVISGVLGSGKTGSVHVIACEAGLAKLCAVCGAAGTCARCDMRRIVTLWLGDPQMQPFGVWQGFADLMAWGPLACVHMIIMAHAAMRERAARRGSQTWTDHRGRVNTGRGSFDPAPDEPILYVIVDEWPMIIADPLLFKLVAPFAASIVKEGRKVGVVLVLLTQMPDLSQLGLRELRELLKAFNVLSHRTDSLSTHMLGIKGDTSALAPGVHGIGYINGVDNRPAAVMRTKHLPEYAKPGETGADVRELAERISRDPVHLDAAVLDAIGPLGYPGRHQVLGGELLEAAIAEVTAEAAAAARARRPAALTIADALSGIPAQPGPQGPPEPVQGSPESTPVSLPLLAAVLAERGEMDLFDVSEAAGVDALEADRLLGELAAAGLAVQTGPGRYRAATVTGRI